ncbi:MAG: TIGR00730 family Rossman fold protein [Clostridia bacterium]|nr:TIGR00730 family Rossman fold protein [Clostridia bacterium]
MKVTVYGAASNRIDDKYIKDGFELGKRLGERGHSMVFGAGSDGLMGAVARGFKSVGAFVHGVIPTFFEENGYEKIFYEADKITYTETMAERKAIMEDNADAFVITPGGIGTYEEFFQIITLKQLGRHQKAIALFNSHGYFDDLKKLLEDAIGMGFVNDECKKLALFFDDMDELIDYIENYNTDDIEWNLLKR